MRVQRSLAGVVIIAVVDTGALVVAAAGNDDSSSVSYRAAYSERLAVSVLDSNENVASFSQYGDSAELCAPGVNVLSTGLPTLTSTCTSTTGTTANASPNDSDYASDTVDSQAPVTIDGPDGSTDLRIDVDSYGGAGSDTLPITESQ